MIKAIRTRGGMFGGTILIENRVAGLNKCGVCWSADSDRERGSWNHITAVLQMMIVMYARQLILREKWNKASRLVVCFLVSRQSWQIPMTQKQYIATIAPSQIIRPVFSFEWQPYIAHCVDICSMQRTDGFFYSCCICLCDCLCSKHLSWRASLEPPPIKKLFYNLCVRALHFS